MAHPAWLPDDVAAIVEDTIAIYRRRNQTGHLCAAALEDGKVLRWRLDIDGGPFVDVTAPARAGRKVVVHHLDGTVARLPTAVRDTLNDMWDLYQQQLASSGLEPRHIAAAIGAATHTLRNRDAGLPAV